MSCQLTHLLSGRFRSAVFVLSALTVPLLSSCGELTTESASDDFARVQLHANLAGTPATVLRIEITAPDLPNPMAYTIEGRGGIATAPISLPYGATRTVSVQSFDANGTITHVGTTTLEVSARDAPSADISMSSIHGGKTFHVRLGIYAISVIPEVREMAVDDSLEFIAAIVDINGEIVDARVEWSTTHRGIVSIDHHGLAIAVAPGVATVAAEYNGTVGFARVFVAGEKAEFFVHPATGTSDNPGTRDAPFATIQQAIDAAHGTGVGGNVFIAGGTYVETLTLQSHVSVFGGFDPVTWLRDVNQFQTNVFGGEIAVAGTGVESLTVDGLLIWSADASTPGGSSIGLKLTDSRLVEISRNTITAGVGADGVSASNAHGATNGLPGINGRLGGFLVGRSPGGETVGNGGAGGAAQPAILDAAVTALDALCDVIDFLDIFNLLDGLAFCTEEFFPPTHGTAGSPTLGGAGGIAAEGYLVETFNSIIDFIEGGPIPAALVNAGDGQNGSPGGRGADGTNGNGGAAFGTFTNGVYNVGWGGHGTAGQLAGGGGGGGGGGGTTSFTGGGGGGGGAGGDGGSAGIGGEGGGGSFAFVLINSTDIEIRANIVTTGRGGRGGTGGAGGPGGAGGSGGMGGEVGSTDLDFGGEIAEVFGLSLDLPGALIRPGGKGGSGGWGGVGGNGGAGGGGGGGPTIGIVEDRESRSLRAGNTFVLGHPGSGAESLGSTSSVAGNTGLEGVQAEFAKLTRVSADLPFLELIGAKTIHRDLVVRRN